MSSNIYGADLKGGALSDLKYYKGAYKIQKGSNLRLYGGNVSIVRGQGLGSVFRGFYTALQPMGIPFF